MNSGPTAERVYDALKRRVIGRMYRPGERLDPARLGEDLHSSVTPVRDALHVLAGEGLVETRTSDGFHVAPIDAPALQDLYQWNGQILLLATRVWPARGCLIREETDDRDSLAAHAAAMLFTSIAARSANAEHLRAVHSANDRLEAVRMSEAMALPDPQAEIAAMTELLERGDTAGLRRSIAAYHRRRRRAAAEIVRALYRSV